MNLLIRIGIFTGVAIFLLLIFRATSVTFVDNHELGYKFNRISGTLDTLDRKGYFIYVPIAQSINTIDLRPFQVCINANGRVLNCKLVKFNPRGFFQYINIHGIDTYSVNGLSSGVTPTGNLYEIMKSYAYSSDGGREYPFLDVLKEIKDISYSSPVDTLKDDQ